MDTSSQISQFTDTILNESTLLFLEPDEQIRKDTLSTLEKVFKKVLVGSDGKEGLELFHTHKLEVDLILTDIDMPNLDGIEFLSHVREEDSEIPVLIFTVFNDINQLIKTIKLKITDYIVKPMQLNTTLKIMHKILDDLANKKVVEKQRNELVIYKDILDKENLVSETDLNGIITYANDIFCEVSGYTREELIGKPHNIVRHPDISKEVYRNLWETIQNKETWKGKIKNRAKDGSTYYVQATVFPILDNEGNIEKYVGSRFLITEQEEERHKLKKYIMHQKSQKVKHEKQLQEEFQDAVHAAKMETDEKMAKFIQGLNEQIKSLREKHSDDKGRILSLERKYKESNDKLDNMQKAYQEKVEKLHKTAVVSLEKYNTFKKKNALITEKIEKSQEAIKTLQSYIDEYRKKIADLEDLIEAYEKQYGKITVR
ncbi:response regulator [Halarcobacter sp.]|uniref:response regulator n=1 Tax=Halarcobacter TaxID=2321115 RepID=UPI003A8F259D